MKYFAFISYSHKDGRIADWLHKGLETYKVPKSLIGTSQRNGVVPRRIFPVFRDRDELPTSSDLGESIRQALNSSQYLIVIASPDSAKSRWVEEEVSWFKKVRRNSNVLVLIARGEPNATDRGSPETECFCPSLKYHVTESGDLGLEPAEPIAADMRLTADGQSRAILKIVAGILGVSFDDIYKREARRRRKRMIGGAVGAIIGAIAVTIIIVNLQSVQKTQSELVGEQVAIKSQQKEIQDAVVSMKESGPYKEIGKLPKARREALEDLIRDSGIELLIASMQHNVADDTKQESELLMRLRHLASIKGATEVVEKNPGERDFIKLRNIWLDSFDEEYRKVENSGPDLSEKWNQYQEAFLSKFDSILGFPANLEEKLVVEDLYDNLNIRLGEYQGSYYCVYRRNALENIRSSMEASLNDRRHVFSMVHFTEHYEEIIRLKREPLILVLNSIKNEIVEYGSSSVADVSRKFDSLKSRLAKAQEDFREFSDELQEIDELVAQFPPAPITIPDYYTKISDICRKQNGLFTDLIKSLKDEAKISDEKVKSTIESSGKLLNEDNIERHVSF